ncbi:MAG: bifunctional folylpolyglutamate synthase/dihydrofolate synthase [Bacteroidales bacterium]|nr:bifunctional folylpolyglutamate synthase/dihydrofolate synthase [Bacteroidales bacterium]
MNYKQTLDYIYARLPMFHRVGAAAYKANLDNTLALSEFLGKPELKFRTIHIAGTNGKGSTSHFLASVLQESGYKCGLFTSPHLKDFRERIKVNGKMIPKACITAFVNEHKEMFEQVNPSFFEWTFALAASYFASSGVDVAVMETGMGGRLDSTNIIQPDLCIITNIGYDHMQFLGDTLAAIASEKAGIIKPGIPVVIGESHTETMQIFSAKAREKGSAILFADKTVRLIDHAYDKKGRLTAKYKLNENYSIQLTSPLSGSYQLKNLSTCLTAIERLRIQGYKIEESQLTTGIKKVLKNTGLKGRWQIISRNPLAVADIGHNRDGIAEVLKQVNLTPHKQLHFVIGVVNDKEIDEMLRMLPASAIYYFCKADIPRGLDVGILSAKAHEAGLRGNSYGSVAEAYKIALCEAGKDDLVVVGGSAFVVAEVI